MIVTVFEFLVISMILVISIFSGTCSALPEWGGGGGFVVYSVL